MARKDFAEDLTANISTAELLLKNQLSDNNKEIRPPARKKQTRSKHFQILITPDLYDRLKERADQEEISINQLINEILEDNLL